MTLIRDAASPAAAVRPRGDDRAMLRAAADLTRRMLPALPDNRALIAHIVRHGLPIQ